MENLFEMTLPMSENFDSNIFEQINAQLHTTVYFKYIAASYAKDFFKNKIQELDQDNTYMRVREVEDVDPETFEKAKEDYKINFAKLIVLANAEIHKWQEDHNSYYRMQPSLPSSSKYAYLFDLDLDVTLEEAIQGYKSANEALKSIDNSQLDKYCTELKPMLNYEHRDEYEKFKKEIYTKYGLLSDSEIKETLKKVKIFKTRLSLDRTKCNNFKPAYNFITKVKENLG